jgi:predicted CXXCH cytochrome family protein
VRRLALLLTGGAVWLFLAAIPVLADGGPHISTINSGTAGINADSCAGCHRAHTAQASYLLIQDESTMCLSCHGASGTGATTDVMDGVQYRLADPATGVVRGEAILGALRNGGFENARIGSGVAVSVAYARTATENSFRTKVPSLSSGQAVTSSHIPMEAGLTSPGRVWGNGALDSGPGARLAAGTELECTSCHNPHGNGNYRILNPIPTVTASSGDTFTAASVGVNVADAPLPATGDTRNYTIIQAKGTQGSDGTYLLYASQVVSGGYANTAGDYWHRTVPWDTGLYTYGNTGSTANDAPNGHPASGTFNGVANVAFNYQINAWCSTCHTRYATIDATGATTVVGGASWNTDSGDAIFMYRHSNSSNKPCTTCHVAHGSNAQMDGIYSANERYPGGIVGMVGDSRLLKLDNRGTCQACHDPTGTITTGQVRPTGATKPAPNVP